jgi:phosphate transport system substrate-binding protein
VTASGAAVGPSEQSVLNGSYQPLSRPIFIYVSDKANARAEVRSFVEFYLRQAAKLAKEVKYVPLPARAYELALAHVKANRYGTVFGGVPEVGVTIEELLKREAK